ncbi:MAG: MaoC family dehydratase [Dehalococcoidia bacterium]|nr:MaoC family dehydratase [Dehalococcoidia bacterium]
MAKTLSFDTLKQGDELNPVRKQITQEKINQYAEASGDFNPLHIDPDFAKGTFYGGTIAHGLLSLAYISEMMTKAFAKGWLAGGKLTVSFLAPVRPGDTITARGLVKQKKEEGGQRQVVCEVYCENQKGERVVSGEASAIL